MGEVLIDFETRMAIVHGYRDLGIIQKDTNHGRHPKS